MLFSGSRPCHPRGTWSQSGSRGHWLGHHRCRNPVSLEAASNTCALGRHAVKLEDNFNDVHSKKQRTGTGWGSAGLSFWSPRCATPPTSWRRWLPSPARARPRRSWRRILHQAPDKVWPGEAWGKVLGLGVVLRLTS